MLDLARTCCELFRSQDLQAAVALTSKARLLPRHCALTFACCEVCCLVASTSENGVRSPQQRIAILYIPYYILSEIYNNLGV